MYTKMTRIKQGKAGLNYLLKESAHNGKEKRNEYLTGVNLVDGVSYFKQFQYYWDKADDRHEVQLRHIIASFSDRELDPKNPAHVKFAHENMVEYAKEAFPNRQILVGTQIDGKSGLIHVHLMVNDCDMIDTAGFSEEQRTFGFLKRTCNQFFEERGLKRDLGRNKDVQVYSQFERIFEEKLEAYTAKKAELTEQLEAATAAQDAAKIEAVNKQISKLKEPYSYKEHLSQRIQEAKEAATDYADFVEKLADKGVIYDDSGKHNKFQLTEAEYHKFTDADYPKKGVCRGKTLNEELFTREALQTYFDSLEEQDEDAVDAVQEPEQERKAGRASTKKNVEKHIETEVEDVNNASYMDAIINYADDFEGDYEDDELAESGYEDDEELTTEDEATRMEQMRAIIIAQTAGEAVLEKEDELEDEDDYLPK